MHRHQTIGVLIDLIEGKNVLVVVDKLDDIPPILDRLEKLDGGFGHAKIKIYRTRGAQEVRYAGRWIKFVSARSPRGLRGMEPDTMVVDEDSPGIALSLQDLAIIQGHGADRVPMLH